MFCDDIETVSHLFFICPVARVIWSIVAKCFGAHNIPNNVNQCWQWCETWLPYGKKFHSWGVAAVCWAIWKTKNKACFEKKMVKNPPEIIFHSCAVMRYWAGLFDDQERAQLIEGSELMLKVAKEVLAAQTTRQVNLLLLQGDEDDQEDDAT